MGFFSKEKEKVPELPVLPNPPVIPQVPKKETKELPELPHTNFGENLNQKMVKSAINDSSMDENIEQLPKNFKLGEKEVDLIPVVPQEPIISKEEITPMIHEKKTLELPADVEVKHLTEKSEPIFVRIDKFQQADKDFTEIKRMVKDIGETQKKIKDIKIKEDAEISGWSHEIEKVKARLEEIDSDIFGRL